MSYLTDQVETMLTNQRKIMIMNVDDYPEPTGFYEEEKEVDEEDYSHACCGDGNCGAC